MLHSNLQKFAGMFVDRTKKYEETMKVAMALAVVGGVIFVQLALHPGLEVYIYYSLIYQSMFVCRIRNES